MPQRIIKFRGWDKHLKEMLYFDGVPHMSWEYSEMTIDLADMSEEKRKHVEWVWGQEEDVEWMQFTGLLDKKSSG